MAIRFLALSDIHGKASSLEAIMDRASLIGKIDAITVSGDISHYGDPNEVERMIALLAGFGVPVFFVLGNCDPREAEALDISQRNAFHLERCCKEYLGLSMTGAGGSTPTPFGTTFEREESDLMARIRGNLALCSREGMRLMLLVHNPPQGEVVDRTSFGRHVGSRQLRELIMEASPVVVQCGHIHEAAGAERIGQSLVFNPGPAMRGNYAVLEIDGNGARVSLKKV